jgi:hypothetical protein
MSFRISAGSIPKSFQLYFTPCQIKGKVKLSLHNLYSFPSIITIIKSKWMRWAGHVARMGPKRNAYRILVGKSEGNRPLGRPRRRCVDNIKMDLRELGWDGVDWIDMAQDSDQWRALMNTVLNLRVP